MEGTTLGNYITRALQLIFGAVVLGVSITMIREVNRSNDLCRAFSSDRICDRLIGRLPSTTTYAAFTGAFGLLDALVGIVGAFLTGMPWIVTLGLDVLATIFYLAGGINSAVLKSNWLGNCSEDNSFCTKWNADTAFMFLGFIAAVVTAGLVLLSRRSGKGRSAV